MGVDNRLVELKVGQLATLGDGHFTDHGQAIHIRHQRTEAVGNGLGQHRNHFTGEVHRGATQLGFGIQRRTQRNVMGYVGNCHVELPATGEQSPATRLARFAIHGIIEVTGVFAVDGDQRQMAQVDPLELILLGYVISQARGFVEHFLGPDAGNIVAAQCHFDFHTGRHVVADHLYHLTLGLTTHGRPLGDLHFHVLALLGATGATGCNQHFLLDLGIVCGNEADAAFFIVTADQQFMSPLDDLDNGTFTTAAAVDTGNPPQHTVAIEGDAHLRGAEEQVFATIVGHQKAEAVAVALHPTTDQIELVHWRVGASAGIDQLAITLHRSQAAAQGFDAVFIMQPELLLQLRPGRGSTALGQQLEDEFATGDGVFVFLCFTLGGRIHIDPAGRTCRVRVGSFARCRHRGLGFGLFRHRRLLNRETRFLAPYFKRDNFFANRGLQGFSCCVSFAPSTRHRLHCEPDRFSIADVSSDMPRW